MTTDKSKLADHLKPFLFTSESAKSAAKLSAAKRRKIDLKMPLMREESKRFDERTLTRVRKQLVLCDRLFKIEVKKYKPEPRRLARLADAQSRLWELERCLCGQPVQPKSSGDPVKSDIPDV